MPILSIHLSLVYSQDLFFLSYKINDKQHPMTFFGSISEENISSSTRSKLNNITIWNTNQATTDSTRGLTPILVLRSFNNSFSPKILHLNAPIHIGRHVSNDTIPSESNGYFNNRVLSRNHAEIWYRNNKVYIKDTRSSNGTFLNGKRLSEENQESIPYELHTGDRLDFGIDFLGEDNVGK
jgi:pSer/pThr/pTyr-binding forkhead associated (FHA) protein